MSKSYLFMLVLSLTVGVVTVGSIYYITAEQPEYLRADRDGVPFYTPKVINPIGNEPLSVGELIRHYKGQ